MPADIRSFFGGGARASQGSQGSQKKEEKPAPKKTAPKKPSRASRVVVDDSDDDDEAEDVKLEIPLQFDVVVAKHSQAQEKHTEETSAQEGKEGAHP